MVDDYRFGRRPVVNGGATEADHHPDALRVCPGVHLEQNCDWRDGELIRNLGSAWGPIRALYEGHAADDEIRQAGSSGGAASALAWYCLTKLGFHGVLHVAARPDTPYLNETVLSTTREQLLARTGSRYAPASPCDGMQMIVEAPEPCVFIGKPCDVAAVQQTRRLRPELNEKIGLTIAFFCAGVPSTQGTLDLLKSLGVDDPARVESLRYRGNGWPGRFVVRYVDAAGANQEHSLTYDESWAFLQRYRQWRCYICPDHTGEFADIAVGDPWYRTVTEEERGDSLCIARTTRGSSVLSDALRDGYMHLERAPLHILPGSSPAQPNSKGMVWGRLVALSALGLPIPRYVGLPLFRFWLRNLSLPRKLRAFATIWRRVRERHLRQRQPVHGTSDVTSAARPVERV